MPAATILRKVLFMANQSWEEQQGQADEEAWEKLQPGVKLVRVFVRHECAFTSVAFHPSRRMLASGTRDWKIKLWNTVNGEAVRMLEGHVGSVFSLAFDPVGSTLASGGGDHTIKLWEAASGKLLHTLEGHTGAIRSVAFDHAGELIASGSEDLTVKIWEPASGKLLRTIKTHGSRFCSVTFEPKGSSLAIAGNSNKIILREPASGKLLGSLEGHGREVHSIAFAPGGHILASGSADATVKLWDAVAGKLLHTLEGHTDTVDMVAFSADGQLLASRSSDGKVRLWSMKTRKAVAIIPDPTISYFQSFGVAFDCTSAHFASIGSAPSTPDDRRSRFIHLWELDLAVLLDQPGAPAVTYTSAKVVLVGETGVGKTGLSQRLALDDWQPSDSTVGAWATHWKLPVEPGKGIEREIWLWDFGGQADQRLIHQLYMDETALAVLVFDGQNEYLFETLGQWDRDLTRAARKQFAKLLVAGRVDAGGLRVSRNEVEKFAKERKFQGFLETSAKKNLGCEELKQAILAGINWDEIPCRTTEVLFKRLKEEIIRLKDEGRVLMRFNELRKTLQLRLSREFKHFADDELRAVLTLLAGPGVLWELAFGSWVLFQPERINAYAQAVIRTLQTDEHQRGCLMEERVLNGDLVYESSMTRLAGDEERFVLLALHQTLVERGLCLRQPTAKGNLLVFPSYYRRERPEQVNFPAVLVKYRFTGFLDEIYATLVVRLHHTEPFQQDQLWRYAADFKTNSGKQLGVKLTRRAAGLGELEVYFDPAVSMVDKIIFSKYVHEHLLQHAQDVERLRHYVCPRCGTPVGNHELAMKRLNDWLQGRPPQPDAANRLKVRKAKDEPPSIICVGCEKRVPLWDKLERCLASPEIQQRVRDLQEESAIELSNQSKERALVGEVISTVALADQISREFNVSDQGIDMEIEFTDDAHEATGAKLYLQLKSGDSYLRERKSDGAEIFTMKDERHARYWMAQVFPVVLVIRNSEGEVRWMEVRDWLKRASDNGKKPVKQIVFEGERFDVMSVRLWREKVLGRG